MAFQHLRSSTANKRPLPGSMSDGQIAINTNTSSPGLFFKDSAGALVKVGPVHVGSTAPNVSPAGGGETGNTVGEQWLDTSGSTYVFKVWDGSAWRSEAGEFVNVTGDVMTGALGIIAGSAGSPGLYFSGDTNTGLYSPGADQVAISTGGSGRLFVDASGNVGVGAIPSNYAGYSNLVQSGPSGSTFEQRISGTLVGSLTTDSQITLKATTAIPIVLSTSNTERLRITSAGLVGVGSSTANKLLQVGDRTGATNGCIEIANENGTSPNDYTFLQFAQSGNPVALSFSTYRYVSGGNWYNDLRFNTGSAGSSSTKMTLTAGGAVGIGTTPDSVLHVDKPGVARLRIGYLDTSLNYYDADTQIFRAGNTTERARIDSSGRLLVGTSSARTNFFNTVAGTQLQVEGTTYQSSSLSLVATGNNSYDAGTLVLGKGRGNAVGSNTIVQNGTPPDILGYVSFQGNDGSEFVEGASIKAEVDGAVGANDLPSRLVFSTTADGASSPAERMRIDSSGRLLFSNTSFNDANTGFLVATSGQTYITSSNAVQLSLNRLTNDGELLVFKQDNTQEGSVTVSGTTVSYNGAHLSRWSQLPSGAERTEILRGSVLSNLDEMCEWGDEDNEQLNRMKVSDVEGDLNVAGVFQAWDDDDDTYTNDFYCAMTGDFIIRIAEGVAVERGDLLMSAGDGTAKPQDDDIIRSKTIAKVTSINVSCTYDDGSYCVPCVLMAC